MSKPTKAQAIMKSQGNTWVETGHFTRVKRHGTSVNFIVKSEHPGWTAAGELVIPCSELLAVSEILKDLDQEVKRFESQAKQADA